ncbi:MAG TPA: GspH/FimT family pseudopilin [Dokdonella sp.]|uniref:GspH/FimT family pseudopilin n=1 Tax=Dokdonella sp. TaxID=2291710 RepID=UPI002D7FFB82|nr:GspH/FimT family pseudopilin [Dokdonella sp.]HET9033757.1 GspH/FimT family pseudopilin [Dokdonella sp.]
MQTQKSRLAGVTLVELMIVVSIGAVLTTMALPSFSKLLQASASRASRSALSVSINQARIGAAMRGQQVIVCPSSNQTDCTDDSRWQHGWIAFIDSNRDNEHDSDEEIIGVAQAQKSGIAILSSSSRQRIRYQADGSASGTNLTLTVCDRRGPPAARTLVVSNSGRLRSGTPSAAQASAACAAIDS